MNDAFKVYLHSAACMAFVHCIEVLFAGMVIAIMLDVGRTPGDFGLVVALCFGVLMGMGIWLAVSDGAKYPLTFKHVFHTVMGALTPVTIAVPCTFLLLINEKLGALGPFAWYVAMLCTLTALAAAAVVIIFSIFHFLFRLAQ